VNFFASVVTLAIILTHMILVCKHSGDRKRDLKNPLRWPVIEVAG
jgi:hypothetical protein